MSLQETRLPLHSDTSLGSLPSPRNAGPEFLAKKYLHGASLVVQWLRICRPMRQGDTGSISGPGGSYPPTPAVQLHACAAAPEAQSLCSEAGQATAMRSPSRAVKSSPHSLPLQTACTQPRRPSTAKKKYIIKKKKKKYLHKHPGSPRIRADWNLQKNSSSIPLVFIDNETEAHRGKAREYVFTNAARTPGLLTRLRVL